MSIIVVTGTDQWFSERLSDLRYQPETLAYVAGVLTQQARKNDLDMSDRSMVMAYASAVETGDFVLFQLIGDWILWVSIIMPGAFNGNREIVESIGRRSYRSCHRMLNGKWKLYEELADELPTISADVRHKLL